MGIGAKFGIRDEAELMRSRIEEIVLKEMSER